MSQVLLSAEIPGLNKFISGKVRDVYDLGDKLLIVATDRISAFDVILPTGIPGKGRVLTQLSLFWYEKVRPAIANHLISAETGAIAGAIENAGGRASDSQIQALAGRTMLVRKAEALPVECVARGYISGSLWKEYRALFAHGGEVMVNGIALPVGLRESDRLPEPIFTPATKAHEGHDENVSFDAVSATVGERRAEALKDLTLRIYNLGADYARERGIIIADTKFEFGVLGGELILIDEVLTPDSSRFWGADAYQPGKPQGSFDKQFVRDYLETLDWPKTYPGPALPSEVVDTTAQKYRDAYTRITGHDLD
jgi:phosphoribosylaminoimidazole-succinocarboxamide synthase